MDKYINLIIHPKTLGFPYIVICKRKIPFYIGILASVGPIVSVVRISPHYRSKNGSLMPIGHKGRFLPFENRKKRNGNSINRTSN